MAQKEPKRWITVNGKHIPIYKDEGLVTKEQLNDMLMDMSDADFKKQMRVRGHKYFAGDFGRDLNGYIASNEDMDISDMRPDYAGAIRDLDDAMVSLSRSIKTERYADEHTLQGFDIKHPEKMIGKTIRTPGYLSTTYDAENTDFEFSNYPAKIIISAPKGTDAILEANHKEAEVLYARGTSYTITSYVMSKNKVGDPQIIYYAIIKKKGK